MKPEVFTLFNVKTLESGVVIYVLRHKKTFFVYEEAKAKISWASFFPLHIKYHPSSS